MYFKVLLLSYVHVEDHEEKHSRMEGWKIGVHLGSSSKV